MVFIKRLVFAVITFFTFGLLAAPASAQVADEIVTALEETGVFVSIEEEVESDLVETYVDQIQVASGIGLDLVIVDVAGSEQTAAEFSSELLQVVDYDVLAFDDGQSFTFVRNANAQSLVDLDDSFACSNDVATEQSDLVSAVDEFVVSLEQGCEFDGLDEVVEEERDSVGGETLQFVLEEISDDETYVGASRDDISEEALRQAVAQVNADTGLRLVALAPDNPQPSARSFALRVQEATSAEVLLFVRDGLATSSVTGDETQPLSSEINSRVRNQGCATQSVWGIEDEGQAVVVFGDQLANGCGFRLPAPFIAAVAGLAFFAVLLGLVTVKEKEHRSATVNSQLSPPTKDDLVLSVDGDS